MHRKQCIEYKAQKTMNGLQCIENNAYNTKPRIQCIEYNTYDTDIQYGFYSTGCSFET
jgi:hypothetical protein